MTEATTPPATGEQPRRSARSLLSAIEVDTRLLGMIGALAVIWLFFNILSGGNFITPRNLWNLSVQSASIAIMATGMVLIIVSRNIDLSVGSMLGFLGYTMAMLQAVWIPTTLGMGFDQPLTWVVTILFGILIGAAVGGLQGFLVAYGGIPSFIVTLGGLLVWRGLIFRFQQGQTIAPLDSTFRLLGGGPEGALGDTLSWVLGVLVCLGIVYTLWAGRRRRRRYDFPTRPMWAEVLIGAVGCAAVLVAVWVANSYLWPPALAEQAGFDTPPAGRRRLPGPHPPRRRPGDDATWPRGAGSAATSTRSAATRRRPSSAASTSAGRSSGRSPSWASWRRSARPSRRRASTPR